MKRRAWWLFGTLGTAVSCLYFVVPSGLPQDVVYQVVSVLAVAAIMIGIRMHRPAQSWPWRLMLAAQILWSIGDASDAVHQDILHSEAFPSVTDSFYLCGYPLMTLALILCIGMRSAARDMGGHLDAGTLTAGLATVGWVLLAQPTIEQSSSSVAAALVAVAYPIGDIVLAAALTRIVTQPGGRTLSFRLLVTAVTLLLTGDTVTTLHDLWAASGNSSYDVLWLLSYTAWGMAALHPSMGSLTESTPATRTQFTVKRLTMLSIAVLVGPGLLAVQAARGDDIEVWPIVIGTVVTFGMVIARMYLAIVALVVAHREKSELQDELSYSATHDALTDLPNRAQAVRSVQAAMHRAQRAGSLVALLFIDLDGFKAVNDTYGHAAGDTILQTVAERLRKQIRQGDLAARLGGDEFVVLLENVATGPDAVAIGNRIIAALCEPVALGNGHSARVGASIGLALNDEGMIDVERLFHAADAAVYRVKDIGGRRVEVFDDRMRRDLADRVALEDALFAAIRGDELVLHYQPVVELTNSAITGFEALVRWERPGVGLVMPGDFLPIIENTPLMCDLDTWVLRTATRQARAWADEAAASGGTAPTVAVNLSAHHLRTPGIVDTVMAALDDSGLDPQLLVLEVTETAFIDHQVAAQQLTRLQALGVSISIDDFGTGYNWITRLRLPYADIIKTDRSFLGALHGGRALLEYTVQVAHAFGLPIIVEGVEHAEQLEYVRSLGCESAQGYLLSKPMTADEASAVLAAERDEVPARKAS